MGKTTAPCFALLLLVSCAKQQPLPLQPLWDTPPVPQGAAFFVDDIQVDGDVLNNFLTRPWSVLCAEQAIGLTVEELEQLLFADAVALMKPLVRAELLLREAVAQFPELDEREIASLQKEMEANVGTALESFHNRYGDEGWKAHVLRQLRLRKLHEAFREYSVVVSEDQVQDYYDEHILVTLPSLTEREQEDFDYEAIAPILRNKLEKEAIAVAQGKWIDEHLPETSAVLKLRDGQEVIIY